MAFWTLLDVVLLLLITTGDFKLQGPRNIGPSLLGGGGVVKSYNSVLRHRFTCTHYIVWSIVKTELCQIEPNHIGENLLFYCLLYVYILILTKLLRCQLQLAGLLILILN